MACRAVSPATGSVTSPSEFMLVAAMNPCRCGYFGDLKRECRCGPLQVQRYRQRISRPLSDRIDLHIEVPAVEYRDIARNSGGGNFRRDSRTSETCAGTAANAFPS